MAELRRGDQISVLVAGWEIDCCLRPLVVGQEKRWNLTIHEALDEDEYVVQLDGHVRDGTFVAGDVTLALRESMVVDSMTTIRGVIASDQHGGATHAGETRVLIEQIEVESCEQWVDEQNVTRYRNPLYRPIESDHRWSRLVEKEPDDAAPVTGTWYIGFWKPPLTEPAVKDTAARVRVRIL